MPYNQLPMTQEELEQTLALYQSQDMSASFSNRDLSLVFPTADEFAKAWSKIPCSGLQKHLMSKSSYHSSLIRAIGAAQLEKIAQNSGGWPRFFAALGDEKEYCLELMVDNYFRFELSSQQVLGGLLVLFPNPPTWRTINSLFNHIDFVIHHEQGLTGFLTEHFQGNASLLYRYFQLSLYINLQTDDPELIFKRIPDNSDLMSQFYSSLAYQLKYQAENMPLSDEQLSKMLILLPHQNLATLLRQTEVYHLTNRPNVIKAIALRHGQVPLINRILMNQYLDKVDRAFWIAQWHLLLPSMASLDSARQLLAHFNDDRDTLLFLDQYQGFIEQITPLLNRLGIAKKILDLLSDPLHGLHIVSTMIDSEEMKNDSCGIVRGLLAIPFLALMVAMLILSIVLTIAGFMLKIPLPFMEIGKAYEQLSELFKELPGIEPSKLVQTYNALTPYHQSLQREFRGTMFAPTSSSEPIQSPGNQSDAGLAYAVFNA